MQTIKKANCKCDKMGKLGVLGFVAMAIVSYEALLRGAIGVTILR